MAILNLGSNPIKTCGNQLSRRSLLKIGTTLPLVSLLGAQPAAEAAADASAKSVLFVNLIGAPSHIDLFDPKPKAPAEYRGPFAAIQTRTPGVHFSELLPKSAAISDKYTVVRTNVNHSGDHLIAMSTMMSGYLPTDGGETGNGAPAGYQPNYGSIVSRSIRRHGLPSFVSLAKGPIGDGRGPSLAAGGNVWGRHHDPFMIHCDQAGAITLPGLDLLEGLSPGRLSDRRKLQQELNTASRRVDGLASSELSALYGQAYNLLTSARSNKAFNIEDESKATRQAYGQSSFGQSCLLGRRLVEAGVPYVQVNWSQYAEVLYGFSDYGWDTHADNFGLMEDWHGPLLDHVFSTLMNDLDDRGLLDTTLVIMMGEFGRTPRINSIGSRDHWHDCYFSIWAGAGVPRGQVVGMSDRRAEHPLTNPLPPAMVGTTILEKMGISGQQRAELNVLQDSHVFDPLM
jgi:hypothetical protein